MSEKVRKRILFYGRVQGVGFRFFSVYKARLLGLTGWVTNQDDGSVEMEVQGESFLIDELIQFLRQQRYIDITSMEVSYLSLKSEHDFYEK